MQLFYHHVVAITLIPKIEELEQSSVAVPHTQGKDLLNQLNSLISDMNETILIEQTKVLENNWNSWIEVYIY